VRGSPVALPRVAWDVMTVEQVAGRLREAAAFAPA
jgi:hypothetical protein